MFWDGTSSQEYPNNAAVPEGSILGTTFYYTLMTFLIMLSVISLYMLVPMAGDTTLYSKCDPASNLW